MEETPRGTFPDKVELKCSALNTVQRRAMPQAYATQPQGQGSFSMYKISRIVLFDFTLRSEIIGVYFEAKFE
jgi:hypothetical protein